MVVVGFGEDERFPALLTLEFVGRHLVSPQRSAKGQSGDFTCLSAGRTSLEMRHPVDRSFDARDEACYGRCFAMLVWLSRIPWAMGLWRPRESDRKAALRTPVLQQPLCRVRGWRRKPVGTVVYDCVHQLNVFRSLTADGRAANPTVDMAGRWVVYNRRRHERRHADPISNRIGRPQRR